MENEIEKGCKRCGLKFTTNKKRKVFCSQICSSKYSGEQSHIKRLAERRKYTKECGICGQNEYPINEVHHIQSRAELNSFNNNPNNLIVVCPNCHTKIHKQIIMFIGEKKQ